MTRSGLQSAVLTGLATMALFVAVTTAEADPALNVTKLSNGVVVQTKGLQATKMSNGIVVGTNGLQSGKMSNGVVVGVDGVQATKLSSGLIVGTSGLQATKVSIGIVVQVLNSSGVVTRAPLTHW